MAEHDIPTGGDELEQEICHHGFLLETPSLADFESQHGVRLRHRIAPGFAGRRAVKHYLAEYHASSMTDGKAAMEKERPCGRVQVRCIVHDCDVEQLRCQGGLSARLRERRQRW